MVIKKSWSKLTPKQKAEFTKQMKFAGWKNEAEYPKMTYQIKDGKCHGWIDKYFSITPR